MFLWCHLFSWCPALVSPQTPMPPRNFVRSLPYLCNSIQVCSLTIFMSYCGFTLSENCDAAKLESIQSFHCLGLIHTQPFSTLLFSFSPLILLRVFNLIYRKIQTKLKRKIKKQYIKQNKTKEKKKVRYINNNPHMILIKHKIINISMQPSATI